MYSLPFEKVTAVKEGNGFLERSVSQEPKCLAGRVRCSPTWGEGGKDPLTHRKDAAPPAGHE